MIESHESQTKTQDNRSEQAGTKGNRPRGHLTPYGSDLVHRVSRPSQGSMDGTGPGTSTPRQDAICTIRVCRFQPDPLDPKGHGDDCTSPRVGHTPGKYFKCVRIARAARPPGVYVRSLEKACAVWTLSRSRTDSPQRPSQTRGSSGNRCARFR